MTPTPRHARLRSRLSSFSAFALALAALPMLAVPLAAQGRTLVPPQPGSASRALPNPAQLGEPIFVATSDGIDDGALVRLDKKPAAHWPVSTLAKTDGGVVLRSFGPDLYVLNWLTGTVTRVRRGSSAPPQIYETGALSEVQDVHVVGGVAWVTRRADSRLLKIDLASGAQTESLDLSVLAEPGETTSLGTMERDGDRLFVQVTLERDPRLADPWFDRGVLAVVHLPSQTLIDVRPFVPGVQGVALDGAPPHLKMQILDEVRTLYVSTTASRMDERGGIELVDLDTLQSVGYALDEHQIGDLGGFVMTSPEGGWFVFHTDIVASTHLKPFTIADGPSPEPELIVLFEVVDALAYDAARHRIYLPSGYDYFNGGVTTGIYAADTITKTLVSDNPFETGFPPHDVLVLRD